MKKLFLFVLVLALFAACKNDPPAAANTATTTPAGQVENIEDGKVKAVAQYKMMNDLISEMDAMPADFRNKPEVQAIRNEMGDISGKAQRIMQALDLSSKGVKSTEKKIQATDQEASVALDPQDAISSMNRYTENIAAARAKFDQLAGEYKK